MFNLCLLGFFKYTDFFLENFNLFSQIIRLDFAIPLPHILLPLALSFVTFQQIAFLVDCAKRVDSELTSAVGQCPTAIESMGAARGKDSQKVDCHDSAPAKSLNDEKNTESKSSPNSYASQDSKICTPQERESTESTNGLLEDSKISKEATANALLCEEKSGLSSAQARSYLSDSNEACARRIADFNRKAESSPKEPTRLSFIDYCLFITFFPQLIAGPIVHHAEMMPQFHAMQPSRPQASAQTSALESTQASQDSTQDSPTKPRHTPQAHRQQAQAPILPWECIAKGLFIFSLGLFKKVMIADSFAKWANAGFSAVEGGAVLNCLESWATSLSYTFQLYFDFSGYCDMAIGLGLLFGIRLPLNFHSPYKACNITDFWRRWHITLGRFLRAYLYIPLGGNRNEKYARHRFYTRINRLLTLRNLFIVAFLSGLWHGAGWGFVVWGAMHGVAMVLHRIYTLRHCALPPLNSSLGNHSPDCGGLEVVTTAQVAPTPNPPQSKQSNTANTRIVCGEILESQANSESTPCHSEALGEESISQKSRDISAFTKPQYDKGLESASMDCHTAVRLESRNDKRAHSTKKAREASRLNTLYTIFCWLLTFNFLNITWIFFRAENLSGAFNLLRGMFGGDIVLPQILEPIMTRLGVAHLFHGVRFHAWAEAITDSSMEVWGYIFGALMLCLACKNSVEIMDRFRAGWLYLLFFIILSLLSINALNTISEFLYFNF